MHNPSVLISVRSGSNRHDAGGTVHNVTVLSYHEKYDDGNNDYDIAVFKVDPRFDFDDKTQPVKLPESSAHVNTNWGLVAGWGYFIVSSFTSIFQATSFEAISCHEETNF